MTIFKNLVAIGFNVLILTIFAAQTNVMNSRIFWVAALFLTLSATSQTYQPAYGSIVAQASQQNITNLVTTFANFGIKYRNTAAQANTLEWLKDQYESYGYQASQIEEFPFTYSGATCKNLVVTKTGTVYPDTYVIICGHYDTVNGPGANDNGSGVSVILETARLLQNVPTEYSIKFVHFAGEEDGLIGSQHYVNTVVNGTTPKMDIRLVFNIDQVGGVAGEVNNTITCERDLSNPTSNNGASNLRTIELRNCVELYSDLNTVVSNAYGSDYVPFENNGEIITGFYETNESPYPHSANDVVANMDPTFVYQVAKAATGALLHFAVACTNCNLETTSVQMPQLTAWPIPATFELNINLGEFASGEVLIRVMDVNGKQLIEQRASAMEVHKLDVSRLSTGVYVLSAEGDGKVLRRRFSVK